MRSALVLLALLLAGCGGNAPEKAELPASLEAAVSLAPPKSGDRYDFEFTDRTRRLPALLTGRP